MPIYNYIALKNNKDIVKGKVEAQDQREARANIKSLGFIPTKVYEEKAKGEGEEDKKVDVKAGNSVQTEERYHCLYYGRNRRKCNRRIGISFKMRKRCKSAHY